MLFVIGPRVDPATLVPLSSLGLFMNGTRTAGDSAHNGTGEEDFAFSDTDADDAPDVGLGDYSMRFEELMSDSEEDGHHGGDEEDEDEEEGFIYNGVDSDPTSGYREQLRQVLGPDHEEEEAEEPEESESEGEELEDEDGDEEAASEGEERLSAENEPPAPAPKPPSPPPSYAFSQTQQALQKAERLLSRALAGSDALANELCESRQNSLLCPLILIIIYSSHPNAHHDARAAPLLPSLLDPDAERHPGAREYSPGVPRRVWRSP